jgi:hypothetical protein
MQFSYFHLLLSIFSESVIRRWSNDIFLRYCFMDARRNERLGIGFQAGAISLSAKHAINFSPGPNRTRTGDAMIKTNILSMAVFALLVNSAALLSLSM